MQQCRYAMCAKIATAVFLFILLGVEFGSAQSLGFYLDKDKKKAVIPFELHNNLVVIPVTVNDKYPMKFILDTGIRPTVIINRHYANLSDLTSDRKIQLKGIGSSEEVEAVVTGPVIFSMPGVRSSGIPVLVLEQDYLELDRNLGTRIHGIIGYDIFSRFVVKIDYAHKKIELRKTQKFHPKKRFIPVDLEIKDSKPTASLGLKLTSTDSLQIRLLIDSGSSNALLLNSGSDSGITVPSKNISTVIGRGLAGEIHGRIGRIEEIQLGKTNMHKVIASFPDETVFIPEQTYERNGSLGGEILRRFTVIFDFYRKKMYLKPNAYRKVPFEYNMSGLEFSAEGEMLNLFVIKNIRPGSPASESGFKQGDIIIRLNNIPANRLTLNKIYTNLNRKAGKKISMIIYREDEFIQKTFRLKREI